MNSAKQIDIFGNSKPLELAENKFNNSQTMKSKFRNSYGYKNGFKCKNCKFFEEHRYNRTYFKCRKLGITSSRASDIRKNDTACILYVEGNK